MANQSELIILEDGWRNAVFSYAWALDGGSLPLLTPMVTLSNFTNNDVGYTALTGFRIDKIQFAVDSDLSARVYWGGAGNLQPIAVLQQVGKMDYRSSGGLQPDPLASGYDGSIMLQMVGLTPSNPCGVTLLINMTKLYKK